MSNIVAIVGRPNVGKSTLFNRLVERRQAIIHDESGVTRDRHYGMSEWNGKRFTVVDTGGYVENTDDIFEKKIKDQVVLALNEANVILFMVDCKNGLSTLDNDFSRVIRQIKKDDISSFLNPSIKNSGLDPDNLPDADKSTMNFGSGGNTDAKAWKDIWGSGQGIGGIKDDPSVEDLVTRLIGEYNQAKIEFNKK